MLLKKLGSSFGNLPIAAISAKDEGEKCTEAISQAIVRHAFHVGKGNMLPGRLKTQRTRSPLDKFAKSPSPVMAVRASQALSGTADVKRLDAVEERMHCASLGALPKLTKRRVHQGGAAMYDKHTEMREAEKMYQAMQNRLKVLGVAEHKSEARQK